MYILFVCREIAAPVRTAVKALYRSGMLDHHLVAVLRNNIFVIILKVMSFYEKCQRTLFACHKSLYKKCSMQFLCKTYCCEEKCISN